MEVPNYEPNSHKHNEEKKIVPIKATGKVIAQKKSKARSLADIFIVEDIASIKDHIIYELVIPAIRDTLYDTVTRTVEMILYGETSSKRRRPSSSGSSFVSYSSFSKKEDRRSVDYDSRLRRSSIIDDIILESRADADDVLDQMGELISVYGLCTVADLYEIVGLIGHGYTDNNIGWKNIRNAGVTKVREGWLLNLPKPIPIDD